MAQIDTKFMNRNAKKEKIGLKIDENKQKSGKKVQKNSKNK